MCIRDRVDHVGAPLGDPPIYVVGLEVELPAGVEAGALQADLHGVAEGLEVELTVEPEEDEVL